MARWLILPALLAVGDVIGVHAQTSTSEPAPTTTLTLTVTATAPATSASASPSGSVVPTTVTTAVPSPALPSDAPIPSQAALPPKQAWCPSEIFCAGALLQTVNVAELYPDSKTFVDKPTSKSGSATLADFNAVAGNGTTPTIGAISNFVQQDFKGEGLELQAITISAAQTPAFLSTATIPNELARAWAGIVNGYWGSLIRQTDKSTVCSNTDDGCESSLIPLNHTFVVPGGRFREQYYWDSFWIMEGLLVSELYDVAKSTLENFMDEIQNIGFIPNGGRIYYLNRSQPPVFIHMLSRYVETTKDRSILTRALPLAEKELLWWETNRTISVTSPYTNQTHRVSLYNVTNSAPRPESYLEDYTTANGPGVTYTEQQKSDLYAELASGAESGWDYSSRWTREPFVTTANTTDQEPLLRGLKVRGTVPVDLNSILYNAETLLAKLYDTNSSSSKKKRQSNASKAATHRSNASKRKAAILDLMWDPAKLAFYDFDLISNARSGFFSAAHFYPMWVGIWPNEVTGTGPGTVQGLVQREKNAMGMFASVGLVLGRYNGTYPATFIRTGAQWDAPNTWPPHQYIVMRALANVPAALSKSSYPQLGGNVTTYSLLPSNQLGLEESQLPAQPIVSGGEIRTDANWRSDGTWTDAGVRSNATETWNQALLRGMVNRYFSSVFCSWYSTGGSIPDLLNQLSAAELNVTHSDPSSIGHMYEKFNLFDVDAAGSGGEYTVQAGFGWTNGAVLWVAKNYGKLVASPTCPAIDLSGGTTAADMRRRWMGAAGLGTKWEGKRKRMDDGRWITQRSREVNQWV